MSNYTKATDFAAKDALPTGDPAKLIKGVDFDAEFNLLESAIATKADSAAPTFTGTLEFANLSDGSIVIDGFVDEDNMASDSAVLIPTQQSVKAYVDSKPIGISSLFDDTDPRLSNNLNAIGNSIINVDLVDGRDVSADGTKLDTIEPNATGDQTASEIRALVATALDSNVYTDAAVAKLAGISAGADITSTANVTAAGALMDSEVTNLAQVKAFDSADYATAAQGALASSALQAGANISSLVNNVGYLTASSTIDGGTY